MKDPVLKKFRDINPNVIDLARLVSLAIRIEPGFLRAIRLELAPWCDASVESDLWFSPLVKSRGIDGIVLLTDVAKELRNQLAANQGLLEKVWNITMQYHAKISPDLRLEEKVAWAALLETDEGDKIIDEELYKMVNAFLCGKALGIEHWACYALPRMPSRVNRSKYAWVFHFLSQSHPQFRGGLKGSIPQNLVKKDDDVASVLRKLPETDLILRRVGEFIEFGQIELKDAYSLRVPDTNPRVLELSWQEGNIFRQEVVSIHRYATVRKHVGKGRIRIRNLAGMHYELKPSIHFDDSFKYDVFISYSSKDKQVVRKLAKRLKKDGLRVWFDDWEIKPGDMIGLKIEQGLEQSRALILAMSRAAFASDWVTMERSTLLFRDPANEQRRFIPLLIENCDIPDIIAQYAYIDWRKPSEKKYEKLIAACLPGRESGFESVGKSLAGDFVRTLLGHTDAIWDVDFSPDGKHLFSAAGDATLRSWDLPNDKMNRVFEGHSDIIYTVSISPDGKIVTTGSKDGTIRQWDLHSGKNLRILRDGASVYSVAWTPNAQFLVSGNVDGDIKVWEADSGKLVSMISANKTSVMQVNLTPDGKHIAAALSDGTIRVFDLQTMQQVMTFSGHNNAVTSVVVMPDGSRVVSASYDRTIKVWDLETGALLMTIEGHTESIWRIAVSLDGRALASSSWDGTVKLWDIDNGSCLKTFRHLDSVSGIAWHPNGQILVSGCDDARVYIHRVNLDKIKQDIVASDDFVRYTQAKVVLLGESGVGKTGLAIRLSEDRWEITGSTHGMNIWPLSLPGVETANIEREVWLWDFAGQPDYRLIHQLYMDETALALMVIDPIRDNPFDNLGHWEKALEAAVKHEPAKILVAGRCDRGGITVSKEKFDLYCKKHGYSAFVYTSAKTGEGCDKLRETIAQSIPWERLPWTASSRLFKSIKNAVIHFKEEGTALGRISELRQRLQLELKDEIIQEKDLRAVVGLLAGQGITQKLDFGDFVLLQPEQITTYASIIIRGVRENIDEIGAISQRAVLEADIDLKDMERLGEADEKILLRAIVQTLLDRSLCLREDTPQGTQLVFPSYFNKYRPEMPEYPNVFVTYGFSGNPEQIYTTLVVRLYYTHDFDKDLLWKDAADFKTPAGKRMGLQMIDKTGDSAKIKVYFEPGVSLDTKISFIKYIHEHLQNKAKEVTRVRSYICHNCGTLLENKEAIKERLEQGKKDITCYNCAEKVQLLDLIEEKFVSDEFLQAVREMDARAQFNLDNESRQLILVGHAFATAGEAGQIFRPISDSNWGIEAEIEFKNEKGEASGKRVYLQLKSGDSYLYKRKDNKEIFTIKNPRHAEFWQSHQYPVMLVIRTSDGEIRWMNVSDYLKRHGKVKQVVFEGEPFTALNVARLRDKLFL
jgi:small GTP-binding protein